MRLKLILSCLIVISFIKVCLGGDKVAGEVRYKKTCINCHGPAGMGIASYPKISGLEVSYVTAMLETYRDGIEVGPNSSLMIMMASSLTEVEISNLAAYLKDARYQKPIIKK
jgi:cytochrome c553